MSGQHNNTKEREKLPIHQVVGRAGLALTGICWMHHSSLVRVACKEDYSYHNPTVFVGNIDWQLHGITENGLRGFTESVLPS